MKLEEPKTGKLYMACASHYYIFRAGLKFGSKMVCGGDFLLFLKPKNIIWENGTKEILYVFLDKDGEELWFEEHEYYELILGINKQW